MTLPRKSTLGETELSKLKEFLMSMSETKRENYQFRLPEKELTPEQARRIIKDLKIPISVMTEINPDIVTAMRALNREENDADSARYLERENRKNVNKILNLTSSLPENKARAEKEKARYWENAELLTVATNNLKKEADKHKVLYSDSRQTSTLPEEPTEKDILQAQEKITEGKLS